MRSIFIPVLFSILFIQDYCAFHSCKNTGETDPLLLCCEQMTKKKKENKTRWWNEIKR